MTSVILTPWMIAIIQAKMRYSKEDKAASRERIVAVAAERIREAGTDAPGVAEIMQAAGMTHGGFYKHFDSRDQLIDEAVGRAMVDSEPRIAALAAEADDPLTAFIDAYLSVEHRDDPGTGCGVAALGNDVTRLGPASQEAYGTQVGRYREQLQALLGGDEDAHLRASAMISTMVGALTIARGLGATPESDAFLRDVRASLRG